MCECFKRLADQLKESSGGFRMVPAVFLDGSPSRPLILVEWPASAGKKPRGVSTPTVIPSFCPFCGTEYNSKEEPE